MSDITPGNADAAAHGAHFGSKALDQVNLSQFLNYRGQDPRRLFPSALDFPSLSSPALTHIYFAEEKMVNI